jgi:hypothetical protein
VFKYSFNSGTDPFLSQNLIHCSTHWSDNSTSCSLTHSKDTAQKQRWNCGSHTGNKNVIPLVCSTTLKVSPTTWHATMTRSSPGVVTVFSEHPFGENKGDHDQFQYDHCLRRSSNLHLPNISLKHYHLHQLVRCQRIYYSCCSSKPRLCFCHTVLQ